MTDRKHHIVLPETFLRCVKPEDRARLKAGMTAAEFMAAGRVKNERDLQGQIVQYLRMKGIEVLWHRTDKKSAATVGWPDITFAFLGEQAGHVRIYACAFEVKLPGKKLEVHQEQMRVRLICPPNAWTCRTVTSLDEVIGFLRERGVA